MKVKLAAMNQRAVAVVALTRARAAHADAATWGRNQDIITIATPARPNKVLSIEVPPIRSPLRKAAINETAPHTPPQRQTIDVDHWRVAFCLLVVFSRFTRLL